MKKNTWNEHTHIELMFISSVNPGSDSIFPLITKQVEHANCIEDAIELVTVYCDRIQNLKSIRFVDTDTGEVFMFLKAIDHAEIDRFCIQCNSNLYLYNSVPC